MKRLLLVFTVLVLLGYLLFSALYFKNITYNQECTTFKIVVKDSADKQFVKAEDIERLLNKEKLHPLNKPLSEINTMEMEDAISRNQLVKSVEVYITQNGSLIASICQRSPVLRVVSNKDGGYYIDSKREKMPISQNYTVYLPVATGYITEEFAKNELYDFVMFVSDHPKWDAWIEQIVVNQNFSVQLVPRAGDFMITIGMLDDYKSKLDKLQLFMKKGLDKVGWNRYSEINLEYKNQVVCTLK